MPDRAEQIRAVLGELVNGLTRWGAAVVSRDGIAVASKMARPVGDETFSAMSAAMLGAAEAAVQEWADDRPQRATIEGKTVHVSVQALDNDFFLAVAGPATPKADLVAAMEVDAAANRLRGILKQQLVAFKENRR